MTATNLHRIKADCSCVLTASTIHFLPISSHLLLLPILVKRKSYDIIHSLQIVDFLLVLPLRSSAFQQLVDERDLLSFALLKLSKDKSEITSQSTQLRKELMGKLT